MLYFLLLILGFAILIKGADVLVEGASSIARKLKISDLVIGLTVVAFGTSAPELFVNIVASVQGNSGITVGNILGSNIANILLVLGVCALIRPLTVNKGMVWREIPFCLLATLVFLVLANYKFIGGGKASFLSKWDGLIFLFFLALFIAYSFSIAKRPDMEDDLPQKEYTMYLASGMVIIGLVGLTLGGQLVVANAVKLARMFGATETMIGLTVVALGTSLPELATSAMSVYKGKIEMAVGNIVGSNIFNIFLVLGVSSLIRNIPFPMHANINLGMALLASVLLFVSMFTGGKRTVDRWEGIVFLVLYFGYIVYLVVNRGTV
jgi:cation:H+ antiporter